MKRLNVFREVVPLDITVYLSIRRTLSYLLRDIGSWYPGWTANYISLKPALEQFEHVAAVLVLPSTDSRRLTTTHDRSFLQWLVGWQKEFPI